MLLEGKLSERRRAVAPAHKEKATPARHGLLQHRRSISWLADDAYLPTTPMSLPTPVQ